MLERQATPMPNNAFDLLIAGAGPAGIAAAITGARRGLNTLLVDPAPQPGGTIVACMHTMLCGLYSENFPHNASETLNNGVQHEVAEALNRRDPVHNRPHRHGRTVVLPFKPEHFREVVDELLTAAANLETRHGMAAVKVQKQGRQITTVELSSGDRISAGFVIDCTGEAAVACAAGVSLQDEESALQQLAGFSVQVDGIVGDRSMLPVAVPFELRRAAEKGFFPPVARFSVFAATQQTGQGHIKFAVPHEIMDDSAAVLQYAETAFAHLRKRLPYQFSKAVITQCSPAPQKRAGARLRGKETYTRQDILSARKFEGKDVVRNAWPIELWLPESGPEYHYIPPGDYCEIPATCLVTQEVENLACAGRCISATVEAAASIRAAGTCLALGQLAAACV